MIIVILYCITFAFFFLLSYHTMSKTCEPLAASVKHFEKLCVRMHGCVRVFVFDVYVQPVS